MTMDPMVRVRVCPSGDKESYDACMTPMPTRAPVGITAWGVVGLVPAEVLAAYDAHCAAASWWNACIEALYDSMCAAAPGTLAGQPTEKGA